MSDLQDYELSDVSGELEINISMSVRRRSLKHIFEKQIAIQLFFFINYCTLKKKITKYSILIKRII